MLKLTNVSTFIGGFQAIETISLEIPQGVCGPLWEATARERPRCSGPLPGCCPSGQGTIEFKGRPIHSFPANKIVAMGSLCPEGRHLFPQLPVYKNLMLGAYAGAR